MDASIKHALERDRTIDIPTTGRKTGQPHRTEIWFHTVEGRLYIMGTPGRRDWYANLRAHPEFTFEFIPIKPLVLYPQLTDNAGVVECGSSPLNRGHEHQRAFRRCHGRDGHPRRLGGIQRGGGTCNDRHSRTVQQ
jgi:hypothetical protein